MQGVVEYINESTHCFGCNLDLRDPIAAQMVLLYGGGDILTVYPMKVCQKCARRLTSDPPDAVLLDVVTRRIRSAVAKRDHDRAVH